MSTPTEPTTPQPKPAAGLRFHNPDNLPSAGEPPWRFLVEGEDRMEGDEFWLPDSHWWKRIKGIRAAVNPHCTYRTQRPLPTPHAAEAGVRAIAEEICRSVFGEVPGSIERADEVADILARHRTAAETVGAGDDYWGFEQRAVRQCAGEIAQWIYSDGDDSMSESDRKQLREILSRYIPATPGGAQNTASEEVRLLESHGFKVIRNNRIDGGSCLALKSECQASVDIYDSGVRVVTIISGPDKGIYEFDATETEDMLFVLRSAILCLPPATQSALEQAREALGVALWVERNGEAQSHAEGRPRLMQRLEIYRTALAALNAVLPPAKGGAQG